ncbi:MAG: tetratricopeptide repeat protein [Thermoguttaceae bacterium]
MANTTGPIGGDASLVESRGQTTADRRSKDTYKVLAVCVFLLLIVGLVFGETVQFSFVNFDDNEYITSNPVVKKGLTRAGLTWAFTTVHARNWHPLTWLSHMLDCEVYGLWAGGHHLTNVLLHAANAILLFLVLRRMTGTLWPAAFVAAVFAVHPLRAESVAWVSERKDVLSGLFFLLTLGAYTGYVHCRSLPTVNRLHRNLWYVAVVVLFAMGLLAKPMLVTLPFVLLLLDYWPLGRMAELSRRSAFRRLGTLVLEKTPLFALSAGSCVMTSLAQTKSMISLEGLSVVGRLQNALVSYVAYLGLAARPVNLVPLYRYPIEGIPGWKVAAALLALVCVTAAVVALWRRCPYLLVGWLWYLGMLVPVIGVVQVGRQAMADRFTYLPLIGIYIAVAWGVGRVTQFMPYRKAIIVVGSALLLTELTACGWLQASIWRDSRTLWTHTLAIDDRCVAAHCNLGCVLREESLEKAFAQFQRAIQLEPSFADAQNNLGYALVEMNRPEEALPHFRETLRVNPDSYHAHTNMGNALVALKRYDEAFAEFDKALAMQPEDAATHNGRGRAFAELGRLDEAMACYRTALECEPRLLDARMNLASASLTRGRLEEAATQYREVLKFAPNYGIAHGFLGVVLGKQGRLDESIAEFRKAVECRPENADDQYNLGFALASKGQLEEAVIRYRLALEQQPDHADAHARLGEVLFPQGQWLDAVTHFRMALKAKPDHVVALNWLAWLLSTCPEKNVRNGNEAVELAQRAVRLTDGKQAESLDVLGAAYAETRRFGDALSAARKALDLAAKQHNAALVNGIKGRITLYEAKRPFRQ